MNRIDSLLFFSVVIPAYNSEKYLATTLESVLNQTTHDWEIVVVDDASTDRTPEILAEYAAKYPYIRVFRNEKNSGIAKTLNHAIREARGKWMVRLDTDDLFVPNYLEVLRSCIEKLPNSDCFISSWVTVIDGKGEKVLDVRLPSAPTITRMMDFENFLYHPATSFPKAVWARVGGYPDHDRKLSEDTEMWKRFIKNGVSLFMIPKNLVLYRIHDSNTTSLKDGQFGKDKARESALARQYHEWRISLFLKQGNHRAARREIFLLKKDRQAFSLKNLFYFFMTLLPKFLVHEFMWELRPRLRRSVRTLRA